MASKRPTNVEFELSRPMTWSEREAFRDINDDVLGYAFRTPSRVAVYAHEDSRILADFIHHFIALAYVNVHLKAIKTVYPRVRV